MMKDDALKQYIEWLEMALAGEESGFHNFGLEELQEKVLTCLKAHNKNGAVLQGILYLNDGGVLQRVERIVTADPEIY